MNQPTHAWLAVEAFRIVQRCSTTEAGKKRGLDRLVKLLDQHLNDVVVAAWLPDSLIKDMTYGHVFKTSKYQGDQTARFVLKYDELKSHLAPAAFKRGKLLSDLPAAWWKEPYRVKDNGGHLPARVTALCQNARDMLKMGDESLYELCEITPPAGHDSIADDLLYTARDVAVMLWMLSHYVADAHMPFHCDNRALASTSSKKNAHGKIEDLWGENVPELFHAGTILKKTGQEILAEPLPANSKFKDITFGDVIPPLKNNGDPWKEAVYTCRASFALSFVLVPPSVAAVDNQTKQISIEDILGDNKICGEEPFWAISRAIMQDAAMSIAMFWQDVWTGFTKAGVGS